MTNEAVCLVQAAISDCKFLLKPVPPSEGSPSGWPPAGGGVHPCNETVCEPDRMGLDGSWFISFRCVLLLHILSFNLHVFLSKAPIKIWRCFLDLVWQFPSTFRLLVGPTFHLQTCLCYTFVRKLSSFASKCLLLMHCAVPTVLFYYGGRNEMKLWSGGCYQQTNKLLMKRLGERRRAPLPLACC